MKYIVALLLVCFTLVSCSGSAQDANTSAKNVEDKKKDKNSDKKRDARVPIEVVQIRRGSIEAHLKASANLETESHVAVLSRTTNLVVELLVEEGDLVKKGAVLARLDNESQRIALDKAQSTYEKNAKEYERQKHLVARNLVSDKEFADTTYTYNQGKLDRDDAQLNYDHTIIRAPIDGTVTHRLVNLGDQVNNNEHLFDIVDFQTMVALIYLPEEHLPLLEVGQTARIDSQSLPGQSFKGKVLRVAPIVDARSGTVKVTVKMDAQGHLRPGMYVDVSLITDKKSDVILVPKKALVYDDEQVFIYRVVDGKADRILIEPEIIDIGYVKPAAGVLEGDIVVVAGLNGLKDNARVRIINEDSLIADTTDKNKNDHRVDDTDESERGERRELVSIRKEPKNLSREERRKIMQERMKNMTDEERKAFIERRRKRERENSDETQEALEGKKGAT